jgi:hypothetical protein
MNFGANEEIDAKNNHPHSRQRAHQEICSVYCIYEGPKVDASVEEGCGDGKENVRFKSVVELFYKD